MRGIVWLKELEAVDCAVADEFTLVRQYRRVNTVSIPERQYWRALRMPDPSLPTVTEDCFSRSGLI